MSFSLVTNTEREPSKFEKYGEDFKNRIKKALDTGLEIGIHSYQMEAVLKTHDLLEQDNVVGKLNDPPKPALIVAPTGAGKSGMICLLPYILKARKALILTPSKVINKQIARDFGANDVRTSFLFKTGAIREGDLKNVLEHVTVITKADEVSSWPENLVIVNAQKFGGKSNASLIHNNHEIVQNAETFLYEFDLLIVDEAHHYPADTWERIVSTFCRSVEGMRKKVVFLTATPYKMVNGNREFILKEAPEERIAYTVKMEDIIGKTIRPFYFKDVDEIPYKKAPTFQMVAEEIRNTLSDHEEKLNGMFQPQAMILVRKRDEASILADNLNQILSDDGKPFAVAILGSDAQPTLDEFSDGKYRVGITCRIGLEGYDNSKITLCVILRRVKSGVMFSQFIGRCFRMYRSDEHPTWKDPLDAFIRSWTYYGQNEMWKKKDELAVDTLTLEDDED